MNCCVAGKFSFECFSHRRAIMRRDDHMLLDVPVRYPPYTKTALKVFKAAAGLPAIPPVRTILRQLLCVGAVVAGAVLAHNAGYSAKLVDLIQNHLS